MNLLYYSSTYLVVALLTAGFTLYREVLTRRTMPFPELSDYLLLTLSCAAVGAFWPLFIPALALLLAQGLRDLWASRRSPILQPGEASGSG